MFTKPSSGRAFPCGLPAGNPLRREGACSLRVGLLGMYKSQNLGDTSIQTAIMQALQERFGPIKFLGICSDPHDTMLTHGIAAVEWWGGGSLVEPPHHEASVPGTWPAELGAGVSRRLPLPLARLRRINRIAASLDLLIVSGSGQIDDYWGGPWGQPFRLLLWNVCARRHRVPVAFVGVGLDELATRLGAWFSILALDMARFRAFRDRGSLDTLQSMGLKAPSIVCPDLAFGLRALPRGMSRKDMPYVVISPIARSAWPGAEDAKYEMYLDSLAAVAEQLLEAGLAVRFACSQTRMDPRIVPRVLKKMKAEAATKCIHETIVTVDDYLQVVASAQLVVASRLHALILALVAGTPVVAIAYSRKGKQLMSDMCLSEYCSDLRDTGAVMSSVNRALARRAVLRAHIGEQCRAFRTSLESTLELLGNTVASEGRAARVQDVYLANRETNWLTY